MKALITPYYSDESEEVKLKDYIKDSLTEVSNEGMLENIESTLELLVNSFSNYLELEAEGGRLNKEQLNHIIVDYSNQITELKEDN